LAKKRDQVAARVSAVCPAYSREQSPSCHYNALRAPNPHQAFGNGPHHCAGAHLSRRTVGAILLPMMFERFPNMTLFDPASVRWHGFGFRGPLNLPVRLQ
jgi:cytochrome P450